MSGYEKIIWNINGGQVNIAQDNATVNATQNNRIRVNELDEIISAIKSNLSGLSSENVEIIRNSVTQIQEEISKPEPKKNIIGEAVRLIAPFIAIANGTPVLVNNLQKLLDYVSIYMH